MATVSVTSWIEPVERDKSSILRALMREFDASSTPSDTPRQNRHQAIHRRAFLADHDKAVAYGLADVKRRISHRDQKLVVPIDAGIGLEAKVLHYPITSAIVESNCKHLIKDRMEQSGMR